MSKIYWDKIRFLVANGCNYRCRFCHNEGQSKGSSAQLMSLEDIKVLIKFIKDQDISELCFSGGEPFLNKDIVRMIKYADENTTCDIGCATNLSLIKDEQIKELSSTRVKFNIQFPYVSKNDFTKSTGSKNYSNIINTIKRVQDAGIGIGLNTVVQSENIGKLSKVIAFALKNELPLKLLPQIGLQGSDTFKDWVFPILQRFAIDCVDKGTGAIRYTLEKDGHTINVLYIDSPCFTKNIDCCRRYGEIRVLPDMSLQPCLLKEDCVPLKLTQGKEYVLNQFRLSWKDFNHC